MEFLVKKDEKAEKRWSSLLEKSVIPQTLQASQWRPELPVWVLPGSAATAQTERREGGGRNRRKKSHVCNWHKKTMQLQKKIHTMQRFDLTREHSNKTWSWKSCWSRNSFKCSQQKMPQGELKQPWHARLQRHIPAWRALFLPAKCKVTQYYCCHHLGNWQQQRWMSSSRVRDLPDEVALFEIKC